MLLAFVAGALLGALAVGLVPRDLYGVTPLSGNGFMRYNARTGDVWLWLLPPSGSTNRSAAHWVKLPD